jgi:hypothetical protein
MGSEPPPVKEQERTKTGLLLMLIGFALLWIRT